MTVDWTHFRQQLHQQPELSGEEFNTAASIRKYYQSLEYDLEVTDIGGHGLAYVFDSGNAGPTTLIRCELDALPIIEINPVSYRSKNEGVAHLCGHDGHMSIVSSVASVISQSRLLKGRVVFLYQPAEETGQGAIDVVKDPKYQLIKPDYAFALHNYPGLALGHVAVKPGAFNCASEGMIIRLTGKTSHAAHPENGVSPALAMCRIIELLAELPQMVEDQSWVTVIHAKLGEVAFGTAPGDAVVMATLRAETDHAMSLLKVQAISQASELAQQYGLKFLIEWQDCFQASTNSERGFQLVENACQQAAVPCHLLEEPMRWSEDFGEFTASSPEGAMFVLGSGLAAPQLHNPNYDFPDSLIAIGREVFLAVIAQTNGYQPKIENIK